MTLWLIYGRHVVTLYASRIGSVDFLWDSWCHFNNVWWHHHCIVLLIFIHNSAEKNTLRFIRYTIHYWPFTSHAMNFTYPLWISWGVSSKPYNLYNVLHLMQVFVLTFVVFNHCINSSVAINCATNLRFNHDDKTWCFVVIFEYFNFVKKKKRRCSMIANTTNNNSLLFAVLFYPLYLTDFLCLFFCFSRLNAIYKIFKSNLKDLMVFFFKFEHVASFDYIRFWRRFSETGS